EDSTRGGPKLSIAETALVLIEQTEQLTLAATGKNSCRSSAKIVDVQHHVGKKRLGLDDTTYRGIIARVCGGKTSAGDLDERQRHALLDEFKRLGFQQSTSYTTSLDEFDDREPQARLIRALWADLSALGALRDPSEKALRRFVKRVAKVDSLAWLGPHEANAVIEALKQWRKRAAVTSRLRPGGAAGADS
ncbi:MAG TPA: regulatory protein GemA, partial [Candidatus Binataceae bacterium]|nr:regulatory protein GemA [Candidatus Binataceae bacterium]